MTTSWARAAAPLAALFLTSGLLASCSSGAGPTSVPSATEQETTSAPTQTQPVEKAPAEPTAEIVESGFGQPSNSEYTWVTALVHNVGGVGEFATVTFNLYGADDALLATVEQVESFTTDDGLTAVGTMSDVLSAPVARIEANLAVSDYGSTEPTASIAPIESPVQDGAASFVVTNTTSEDWGDLRIGVICKDAAGTVVGGGSAFPSGIPAGGEYMVSSNDAMLMFADAATTCTAYPTVADY
ncbi:MAG: hypothetical protein K0R01_5 [Mycobacterium sp.]|jgi:hypothetical protein|nr:hypothetical protein [Mycobacterium sp.]